MRFSQTQKNKNIKNFRPKKISRVPLSILFQVHSLGPKGSSTIDMACILAQQSFYLKTKTFSDDCFKSTWQGLRLPMFCTATNLRLKFSLFQLICQKNKVLHRIKFNQEILRNFSKRCISLVSICCAVPITEQLTVFVKLSILSNRQRVYLFVFRGYF